VTHFVLPGTPLDVESARRAETFYLVNQRANMVPELLSENLCSLHPNVDRLAFSVILNMDAEAQVLSSRFEKTVIRSRGALSYKQAQARIDEDSGSADPLTRTIQTLNRLAMKLRQRRMKNGAEHE
jgi:exosome complex exonuclease DIS3/RRP44